MPGIDLSAEQRQRAALHVDAVGNPGESVTLSTSFFSIGSMTYQCLHNGQTVVNGPRISGATSDRLAITAIQASDAGTYQFVATNSCGPFGSNTATLTVIVPPCPADLNSDRVINLSDLSILLANFGRTGATAAMGDINGDGVVELTDLSRLLAVFGTACP